MNEAIITIGSVLLVLGVAVAIYLEIQERRKHSH